MTSKTPLTPEQVKQNFRSRGVTVAQWAEENGYHRERVYRVLNGLEKCLYGKSHEIAVKLGIKVPADKSVA